MPHPLSPGAARGNEPGLIRQLGFFSATALVISNMIGMGIFTTTGYMAGDLGSAGLILACWSVGALFAVAGALSYSELGINFPSSGGEYVYLTHAFGPEWGFMTGWVSFFAGFSAPIAVTAATPQIAGAVAGVARRLAEGGRLIYVGAGTAGRLGVLDATEAGPKFDVPDGLVLAVLAGGSDAMVRPRAREGAEDDSDAATVELDRKSTRLNSS